jgi:hypothetical protein
MFGLGAIGQLPIATYYPIRTDGGLYKETPFSFEFDATQNLNLVCPINQSMSLTFDISNSINAQWDHNQSMSLVFDTTQAITGVLQ